MPKVAILKKRESGSSTGSVNRPEDSESSEDSKGRRGGGGRGGGGGGGRGGGGGDGGDNSHNDDETEIQSKSCQQFSSSRSGSPQKLVKRARVGILKERDNSETGGRGGGPGSRSAAASATVSASAAAAAAAMSPTEGLITAEEMKKAMEPLAHQILQMRRTLEEMERERRNGSLTKKDLIIIAIVLGLQFVMSFILLRSK